MALGQYQGVEQRQCDGHLGELDHAMVARKWLHDYIGSATCIDGAPAQREHWGSVIHQKMNSTAGPSVL
jgi:hypothetical protein